MKDCPLTPAEVGMHLLRGNEENTMGKGLRGA
jgi:hypothetical protein